MDKHRINRPAIAMIELIFAIVIIGIVLMSAPQLISTASKSGYVAIQQEAINEAASRINMIMGYHWDDNDTDEIYLDPILGSLSTSSDLNTSATTGKRRGTPIESYRTSIRSDGTNNLNASTTLGSEAGDEDDIDDFNNITIHLDSVEGSTADYVEKAADINMTTTITYNQDTVGGYQSSTITFNPFIPAVTGTTNIKEITVTLTSSSGVTELGKNIVLRAFSCNIGGFRLEERDF